jgi:asparagine synthase (glutamine-hydrolysing)
MCGLTGFIDFEKRSGSEELAAMTASLFHRGPDDSGTEVFTISNATVGLGFRRLSIIDLSAAGHQPMHDADSGQWIVFNGEVYNFREIRNELEALGDRFISGTDTEVILKAYRRWGKACVNRLSGMFAFCIYDPGKSKALLVRDRAGVKPLFYYRRDGLLLFASELKSFHRHPRFNKSIDTDALSLYFRFGYIPAPYSVFRDCQKLLPGHLLEIDLDSGGMNLEKYWDAEDAYRLPLSKLTFEEAVERTESLLTDACRSRMVADVPVGVFLSGGYDSSCVTALLQKDSSVKIKTYTIGFRESSFNEAEHARKVADYLGTDHHEYICTYREAMDIVPQLPEIYDEPFGDSSAIPTTLVSRFARKHVTVALSADAGDELFAGYPRHRKNMHYLRLLSMLPSFARKTASGLVPPIHRGLSRADRLGKLKEMLRAVDPVAVFKSVNQVYTFSETSRLITRELHDLRTPFDSIPGPAGEMDDLSRILLAEYKTYLVDDILQKVDRATMSAGLEGREPFLDHRLQEWVATLPSEFKMSGDRQKLLLKAIVHRHISPAIMDRPKMGFGIPLVKWMREDLRPLLEEVMSDESVKSTGLLDVGRVREIRDAYLNGRLENFERLWFIFSFILWYRRWMKAE